MCLLGLFGCLAAGLSPRPALAQSRPTTLYLFTDASNDVEIDLSPVTYSSSSGACPSGSGQISKLVLFGNDLTALAASAPAVPFQNVCFDSAGNVNGGSVTLKSSLSVPLFNGLGLTLGSGTKLTVLTASSSQGNDCPGGTPQQSCLSFSGSMTLTLPLRDAQGNQLQGQLTNTSLTLRQGQFAFNGTFALNTPNLKLNNTLTDAKVRFGGFAFTADNVTVQFERNAGRTTQFQLTVTQPQVDVPIPIPGVLTQDGKGITVTAKTVAINQNGEIQIDKGCAGACLSSPGSNGSITPPGGTTQQGSSIQVDLASPLGFTLQASSVNFSKPFNDSSSCSSSASGGQQGTGTSCITSEFRLCNTKLLLPDFLPDADAPSSGPPQRIALDVKSDSTADCSNDWNVTDKPVIAVALPKAINVGWNGFKVQIPQGNVVIDLSTAADDPAEKPAALSTQWQGVYIAQANFVLPPVFQCLAGQTSGAQNSSNVCMSGQVAVSAQQLAIGSGGLNVTVTLSAPTNVAIAGFNASLKSLSMKIANNHIDAKDMKLDASVQLPALDWTNWGMQLTDSGNYVLTLEDTSLDPPFFGRAGGQIAGVHLDLTGASLELPATQGDPGSVMLSGVLSFKVGNGAGELASALSGVSVPFKDLGIDTNGKFILPAAGQFALSHPVSIDLKVMKLELTSFSAGNDSDSSHTPFLLLTGGVQAGDGLPVSAEVDFDGLEVRGGGAVKMHGLEVKADVADVLRLDASLQHYDASDMHWQTPGDGCWKAKQQPISCIKGNMKLGLNLGALSLGDGQEGLTFASAQGAWLFTGKMSLPAPIELGQSGMSLYGFQGSVGYKGEIPDQSDGVNTNMLLGDPNYVVYLNPALPGDDLLFSIGTSLGTSPPDSGFTFYADTVATLTLDPFKLDLNARAMFQEPPGTDFSKADRAAYMDIQYSAPSTLHATASADLYYATRSLDIADAHGSMDLLLSPDEMHLFLGWPPDTNPITLNIGVSAVEKFTFSGGLGIHLRGSQLSTDHDPANAQNTGPWFAATLNWHGTMASVLTADIGGSADISLNQAASTVAACNTQVSAYSIATAVGTVYARGQADFGPFSASAEGWLGFAYLGPNQQVNLGDPDSGNSRVVKAPCSGEFYAEGKVEGCGSVFGASVCKSLDVSDTLSN